MRAKKLFHGFLFGVCVVIFCTVSEMDFQDQIEHEKYVAELNARKLLDREFPEEYRPAMSASPAFVGKPSKKYFEGEYKKLRANYEAKRRARWEARQ